MHGRPPTKLLRRFAVWIAAAVLVAAGGSSASAARSALPAHVYAPYFETWTSDSISNVAQASGARYFTLAFLQTLSKSSCTLAWNGDKAQTIPSGRYLAGIAS